MQLINKKEVDDRLIIKIILIEKN